MTRLAGVIGDPISHSRSPRLHGHWLRRYGIDGHYIPLHVRPDDLEQTLHLLPRLGFSGINVTIPHKEAVYRLATTRTDRAMAVEAANTLTFQDGHIHADNTDGVGFLSNLSQGHPTWNWSGRALILGAGGAARGIISALIEAGLSQITVSNRTQSKAQALADLFPANVSVHPWESIEDALSGHDLLVNTTALGMAGQPPLDLSLQGLDPACLVTDIIYTPLETPLLRAARARGNPVVDGLGMLLHQAVPGFETWFGRRPEVDDDLRGVMLK
ncbi:MAG: shikimate dehydrogenase [Pseudomonadota bacterium]